jgi:DNA excision repair protein ERCC-2
MEKTLKEVNFVMESRRNEGALNPHGLKFLAVGLSARKNLCIHPDIRGTKEKDRVDAECRKRTADWVINLRESGNSNEICDYFDNFKKGGQAQNFEEGCYSLDRLRFHGEEAKVCPYYLARELVNKYLIQMLSFSI